jgi:hypothetical protein
MHDLIESYQLVATLAFVLASAVVSGRMLLLARRTRERPELLLGLGVLGTAVLGYGLLIVALILRGDPTGFTNDPAIRTLTGVGSVLHDVGVSMIVLFVLTVFRAGDRSARALAGLMLLALWGGHLGWELRNGYRSSAPGSGFWLLRYSVIWSYPLWTMIESYRFYGLMRRRRALGLADPLVTNRFFLWGSASLGTALATWTASIPYWLIARPEAALAWSPVIQVATATFGIVTVTLYALTFFAPAWYRTWVTGSAAEPGGAAATDSARG